jgi:hypothetical protein
MARLLQAGGRLLVPFHPPVKASKVIVDVGFGDPVAEAAGKPQRGLVGLRTVGPVAASQRQPGSRPW